MEPFPVSPLSPLRCPNWSPSPSNWSPSPSGNVFEVSGTSSRSPSTSSMWNPYVSMPELFKRPRAAEPLRLDVEPLRLDAEALQEASTSGTPTSRCRTPTSRCRSSSRGLVQWNPYVSMWIPYVSMPKLFKRPRSVEPLRLDVSLRSLVGDSISGKSLCSLICDSFSHKSLRSLVETPSPARLCSASFHLPHVSAQPRLRLHLTQI